MANNAPQFSQLPINRNNVTNNGDELVRGLLAMLESAKRQQESEDQRLQAGALGKKQGSGMPSVDNARKYYDTYANLSGRPTSGNYLQKWLGLGGGGPTAAAPSYAFDAGGIGGPGESAYGAGLGGKGAGAGEAGTLGAGFGQGAGPAYAFDAAAIGGPGESAYVAAAPEAGGLFGSKGAGAGAGGAGGGSGGLAGGKGAAGGGSSAMAALGPLAVLGTAAYMGYQHGEGQKAKWRADEAKPENAAAIQYFANNPGVMTAAGLPPGAPEPTGKALAGAGDATYNPVTRRFEVYGMPVDQYNRLQDELYNNDSGE